MRVAIAAMLFVLGVSAQAADLLQKPKSIETGLVKYSKLIPQCSAVKSSKNGILQTLDYGFGKVDVLYELNGSKLNSVTLSTTGSPKNDMQLRAMMCATAALMVASQPDYKTVEVAMGDASRLWQLSAKEPFTMSYFFDQITAQHVPFQAKLWNK